MLTPPGRSVPKAALRAAAAAGVRLARARTTHVSMPPEPRRMTLAPERSMPASGMRAEPDRGGQHGRARSVLTMKLVRRTVVPCDENARPPEWVTRPTAVAGSIAPPVIGKATRRPFAVAGPTGATARPASVSTPAVARVEVKVGGAAGDGHVGRERRRGADRGARGQGRGERDRDDGR